MNELMINLRAEQKVPLYEQIYDYIKDDIKKGRIQSGEKLPSTRALSAHLEVSRSTVELAYEQLLSEGYIEAQPYRGYFVCQIDGLFQIDAQENNKRANREAEVRSDRDGDTENEERKKDTADADEVKKNVTDESGKTDAAAEWMELYLDQHTDSGNQKAIEIGEKARLSVLWKLADAYERSGMKTEQIQTYGQLIEWEQDPIQLEEAGVRKMKLEAAQGDYKQAAETGKKVLERIEASEKITKMLKGYELYKGEEGES